MFSLCFFFFKERGEWPLRGLLSDPLSHVSDASCFLNDELELGGRVVYILAAENKCHLGEDEVHLGCHLEERG